MQKSLNGAAISANRPNGANETYILGHTVTYSRPLLCPARLKLFCMERDRPYVVKNDVFFFPFKMLSHKS